MGLRNYLLNVISPSCDARERDVVALRARQIGYLARKFIQGAARLLTSLMV